LFTQAPYHLLEGVSPGVT